MHARFARDLLFTLWHEHQVLIRVHRESFGSTAIYNVRTSTDRRRERDSFVTLARPCLGEGPSGSFGGAAPITFRLNGKAAAAPSPQAIPVDILKKYRRSIISGPCAEESVRTASIA